MNSAKNFFVCFFLVLLLIQFSYPLTLTKSLTFSEPIKQTTITEISQKISPELISLTKISFLSTTKVLIEVKNEESLKEISLITKNLGGKNIKEFKTGKLVSAEIPIKKLNELALNSKIKFIYPDREIKAALNEGIPQVNAGTAWNYGFTGKNIKIAVLDTGIDSNHLMLQAKVILEEDFSGTGNPTDVFGHGTHVAGIAAGTTEFGATYNGVAPDALLLNGKVLNDYGIGSSSSVIAGINWAVNPDRNPETDDGADIINLSLGAAYSNPNDPINLAIKDATEQGIVVVAAAGNCGEICPSMACGSFRGIGVPGDSPDAITVGATDKQNNWACFSAGKTINGVIKPDLSAPGVNINSSVPDSYAMKSGTSMSAPFVSGAVALMLEANPLMTPNEIKQWLELNSLDLGAAGKDEKFGSGLIDLTNLDKITVSENNTPVFNSINIARNVLTGTENEIIVNVTDNEEIVEVNALIVNPLNEEITFNLIESNNDFWSATFLDTNTTGTYLVELRAVDNQGLQAITSISFNAVESFNDLNQSDLNFTGSQTELFVPEEIIKEEQGLVSLNLFLVAPSEFALEISPKDTTVEFYVKDSAGNIIEKEFVGPIEVPVNQPMDFNYFWGSSIVNDYNIGAVILSEGIQAGIQEKSTLVTVTENSAEITFFGLNENPIEKGITQNYVVNAVNTSEHELSSFIEILYFDSNNNVVHAFSGNKILIEPNSAHLFDENETILLKPGNYELNAILHFENKIVSVNPVNVSVFVPEIGLIESIEIPEEVPVDENLNIKIYFRNNGAIEINPVFFVEIIDGNETISILNFGGEDINAGKTRLFDENWATKVKPGDYNLNITVFYGNAEHEINLTENFSVIDVQEPLLKNILFNNNLMQNKPLLIKAEFNDSSELNVVVSIQGTEYLMNKNSFFGRDSNWNYTFVDTENSGEYFFQITACDEFSNCFTAPENSFTVNQLPAGCSGNKVLVAEQEQNLGSLINSDYCVTEWSLKENGVPSLEYLNRFNAVIWSEGNNINAIDENTSADALIEFVLNGGKILLEGQDIAFSHFDDNLMQFVAHSALFSDLILDENSNESIIVSKKHPITFPLNEIEFNYELSQFPDAVIPTENAFSLAEWNSRNTAINLFNDFNDTNAKTVFFAFNLNALNQETKTILLNNSIEWLLENASEDLIVNEILVPEFVVEGQEFDVNVLLDNTITTIQPKIELYADGELIQSINSNQESILFPVSLSKGLHEIKVFINPDFSFQEKFYLNNSQKKELQVYPLQADLTINSISAETEDKILISAEIQNKGGSTARNALTEIFVDGTKIQEKTNSFNPNQTITVNALTDKNIGLHEIQVKINDSNMVSEDDYSNNSLTKELYVCNKNNILIINDNNTENFSSDNPDSTKSITSILKENNYCFKEWNEKIQGTPEISFLNSFNLIFWSTGNYWNTVINENDTQLLEQFEGNIIFEGADIAFDHAGETFLEEKLHAVFDKDLILETTNLNLNEHRILSGINEILLDENYSPYPDSLIPVNAFSVALWPEAETAVLASDSNNSVYFGFSLNAVSDSSTKEKLVLNSVDWIEESNSVCGDLTGDSQFNVADLTFFVDFLWKGGPEPYPLWTANADGTDSVNVADLTYLVNFLWKGGPAPHCAPAEELKSGNPTQKITLNEIQELIKKNTINQTKHQKTGLKSI